MTTPRLTPERLSEIRNEAWAKSDDIRDLLKEISALEAELTKERHDFNMLMLASDVIEKERDSLKAELATELEKREHNEKAFLETVDQLQKRVSELEAALSDILSNVALDWYVQQFTKNEAPTLSASGIAAKIHNRELYERCAAAFERGRQALAKLREKEGTNG